MIGSDSAVLDNSVDNHAQVIIDELTAAAPWKHNAAALIAGGALANSTVSVSPVRGNVGDLFLGNCTDNEALPGAECGYAM